MLKISKKDENTGTAGKKSAFPITILQDIRAKKAKKTKNMQQWKNLIRVTSLIVILYDNQTKKCKKKLKYSNSEMIRLSQRCKT